MSARPYAIQRSAALIGLVGYALLCPAARLAPAAEPAPKPLEYRRIFVPADQPDDWPKRNVTYWPLAREEFEKLIAAANAEPRPAAAGAARIGRASYSASFQPPDLLLGEARFELPHGGENAALVTLDPFGVSLAAAKWADAGELTIGVQPGGKLAVLVERPGTLICQWSLRGRRDAAGALIFPLALPAAALADLEIQSPEPFKPTLDDAVELGRTKDQRPDQWRFQLVGRPRADLRLQPVGDRGRSRGLVLLQEKSSYGLLPGGIDLKANLKLDVHREPLRRLEIDLDSPLRVVSVQYAGAEVPWSVLRDAGENEKRLNIDFPEPLLGPGRVVTVTALAPLQIDVGVKLPRLHVKDVVWQEGEMSLLTPAPLALDALLPRGCRQTKVAPLTGGSPGESIDLQLFSPAGSVTVQVSRRPERGRTTSGATLRFAADALRAEFRTRVEATEGEWFTIQAAVDDEWEIDAVTADREGALENWSVNRSARPGILILQFAEPVAVNRPLELMIMGHRRLPPAARLAGKSLEMLHFRNLIDARRLLVLETAASQSVRLDGLDRPRLRRRASLSPADRALLPSAFSDFILEVDPDRKNWGATIERRAPRFSTEIRALVEVGPRDCKESYVVHCRPDGSRVDRLLLAYSPAREAAIEFSGDESLGAIVAERLSVTEQTARGLPADSEVWSLHWGQPSMEPFELRAARTLPLEDRLTPALASTPEAAEQQGTVEIRFKTSPLVVESDKRLEPIAALSQTKGESCTGGAAFRYDPLTELSGLAPPAVVLRAPTDAAQPVRAHVWRLRLHSLYRPSGEADHFAVFDIENHGADQCVVKLPTGAELVGARVDGAVVAGRPDGADLKIPLPESRAFPVVVVEYVSRERRLGALARLEAPWPSVDLPVAARQWQVSCGGQYEPLLEPGKMPAWTTRMFGSLARPLTTPPFNPLSQAAWRQAARRWHRESGARAPTDRLLESLGQEIAHADTDVVPLGRLLAASQAEESPPVVRVLVDERALASLSVAATAPIRGYTASDALDSPSAAALAAQRLTSLGLALLLDGEQVVLTSRSAAMARGGDPASGAVFVARAAETSAAGLANSPASSYVSLATWLQSPAAAWENKAAECGRNLDCAWQAYEIEADGGRLWSVTFVHREVVIAASWALGALVFCFGIWLSRRRFAWLVVSIGLAGLAGMWAPAALLSLAQAALYGSLAAAVWQRVRPRLRRTTNNAAPAKETMRAAWSATAPILIVSVLGGAALGDDAEQATTRDKPAEVHRVFVPVDSDNKPGARYYVPTDFLDELRRRASQAGNEPRGWLITSAKYECQLARETLEAPISVTAFTARFKFEVLSPNSRLRLPFVNRQVKLAAEGAKLDGQPIKITWSETGEEIMYDVIEPGLYELELSLRPVLGDTAETRELKLSIPKVALATLDVSLPAEGLAVELPGIDGEQRVLEGGRKLSANLGPLDVLTLRWPRPSAAPMAEVEELLWLKVRPGSVVLDVALKLNVSGGPLREVRFTADRRLRLVPGAITAKELPASDASETSDAPQSVELDLEQPLSGQGAVRLSFLMTGASGVGNLRLPSFHTQNARVVRRWLAVTVDPGLEYETHDAERLEALPAADFAAQWGGATLGDSLTYRLPEEETAWSLATRSREPQTAVKESLSLSFQRMHALVLYEAQLTTSDGYVFQHRLWVPPDIEIEDVALEEEGVNRVSHWARSERGVVSVFLDRRLTGAQRLTLTGRVPVRASGRLALPKVGFEPDDQAVTIERTTVLSRVVRLYRQPTVEIALEDAAGLSPLSDPLPELFDSRLGRLVVAQAAAADYSGNVSVTANRCRVHDLEQLTSIRYANQQWQAEIQFRFKADGGILDFVRLEVPPAWSANLEVVAPVAVAEVSRQPGDNRQELIVRPLVPFSGECRLKLRAAVKFPPGEIVSAPDVIATDLPAGERFWSLPRQVGVETVDWDPERMSPAVLPEHWSDAAVEAALIYRALGERPRAVLSAVKTSTELARVRLCDLRLALSGDHMSAVAAFDLLPGGRASCPLELAAGWQLIEVKVGGACVAPLGQGEGKWEVPLRSYRLPQRVEVALAMNKPASDHRLRWPIAWLENWPVEETLLAVSVPDDYQVRAGVPRTSTIAGQAARLASAVELLELPPESVATTERDELAAWYEPWAHWILFCRREGRRAEAGVEATTAAGSQGMIDDAWSKNARRLGVEQVLRRLAKQPLHAVQTLEVWQQLHAATPAAQYHWTGAAGPGELQLIRRGRGGLHRFTGSLWVVAFFAIALAARRVARADLLDRWPQGALVGLGLLWWLFCQPSAAGWLAIACGLVLSVRSLWRPLAS